MPLISAELRWFTEAAPPAEASAVEAFAAWFRAGAAPPGGGHERIDEYLLDRSTLELGVKRRGSDEGVEVKSLVDDAFLSVQIAGRPATAQLWTKVASRALALPADAAARRAVGKTRWLRKFAVSGGIAREIALGGGATGEEPSGEGRAPDVGCNVEWTRIEVRGGPESSSWCTFGLEAFAFRTADRRASLRETLAATLAALASKTPAMPPLDARWRELGYPAWLRDHVR